MRGKSLIHTHQVDKVENLNISERQQEQRPHTAHTSENVRCDFAHIEMAFEEYVFIAANTACTYTPLCASGGCVEFRNLHSKTCTHLTKHSHLQYGQLVITARRRLVENLRLSENSTNKVVCSSA